MTYASQAMLVKRFGAQTLVYLTDRATPPTGTIDMDLVAQELVNTDAIINGYVGNRYRLPLDPVPDLVTDLALSIAIYKLHVQTPDEKVVRDYDQAIRTLRDIGTNAVKLNAAGIEPASSGASGVQFIDRERPLSPESMTGFI
jgi:phage gp36-like protein